MNTYAFEFFAKCPGNGVRIKYEATIETSELIMVEDILEFIEENTTRPVYHEALADAFAGMFPGLQRMTAHHHGVTITSHRAGDAPSRKGADNDSHGSNEQGSPSPSLRGEPRMLSDEEIGVFIDQLPDPIEFMAPYFAFARQIERAILSRAGIGESRHG